MITKTFAHSVIQTQRESNNEYVRTSSSFILTVHQEMRVIQKAQNVI